MMERTNVGEVLDHLMFHKAMITEDDHSEIIDHYLNVLHDADAHLAPNDPLDRSIETVFELVLNNNLDPWDIDLLQFTRLYQEKVKGKEINFVIAGKLMLMAWSILRMQSEKILNNSEERQTTFYSDWDFESLDMFAPDDVVKVPLCMPDEIELSEVVTHRSSRPVTLVELLDAFEEAKKEEQDNLLREQIREARRSVTGTFDTNAHNDDMERDVEDIWARIVKCGPGSVCLDDICNGGKDDLVTVFMSILFLARAGKISVWQDDMPYGKIYMELKIAWDIGTLEDLPAMPASRAMPSGKEAVM